MPHSHSIQTGPDEWPVAWTHTHHGRGIPEPGAVAVAGVIAAWAVAADADPTGTAYLVVDEDAGFVPAARAHDGDVAEYAWTDEPITDPGAAVRAWWHGYVAVDPEPDDDMSGWHPAARAWVGDGPWGPGAGGPADD